MASTRTPASGTIRMSDLDKSISRYWSSNNLQQLSRLETQDFFNGDMSSQACGFAYCYGTPGTSTPHRLSDYYNIIGWVDYKVEAINLTMFNPGGIIRVNINPMNGSNGEGPGMLQLADPTEIPNGIVSYDGAHWETLQFEVQVNGMSGGTFDVYFDGNYIDTISSDGIYVYDNGSVGYTNGANDSVYITFTK